MTVNKVILVGNLGGDPECRGIANSGAKVTNVSLATSETRNKERHTTWHKLVFFGRLADIVEMVARKGNKVYVEGRISAREYESQGQKKKSFEIVCNQFQMLHNNEESRPVVAPPPKEQETPIDVPEDDIPF